MSINRKIFVKDIIKLFIGLSLIILLITQIELEEVLNAIRTSNYIYLSIGFLVFGFSRLFEGMRLHILIKRYGFKLITAINILFISIFFNNVSSTVIGDGYKIFVLKDRIKNWRTPLALVFLERLIGFAVILLIGLIYLGFNYSRLINIFDSSDIELKVGSTVLLPAGIFILIVIVLSFRSKLRSFTLRFVEFIKAIKNIILELFIYKFAVIVGFTVMSHLFIALKMYILVKSFNDNMLFTDSIFLIFLLFVASYIPISIGSLGVREGVVVLTLTFFSISQPTAAAVAFAARIIIYIYAIVGGILFLFSKKKGIVNKEPCDFAHVNGVIQ